MEITKELVTDVLRRIKFGLVKGLGSRANGQMCVQAVVSASIGESHGDTPSCVHELLLNTGVALNDLYFTSDDVRAEALRRYAVAQLGTNGWMTYERAKEMRDRMCDAMVARCPHMVNRLLAMKQGSVNDTAYHPYQRITDVLGALPLVTKAYDKAATDLIEDFVGIMCDMGTPGSAYLPMTLED